MSPRTAASHCSKECIARNHHQITAAQRRVSATLVVMRVFVTHNAEDLQAYYGRSLPELEAIAQVVTNPLERDLTIDELVEAAADCHVIVAHRSTPGPAEVFDRLPELVAFLRCAVDISTIDVDAATRAGVLIARAAKSFVPSTAELALGLLIDCARSISASNLDYQAGIEPPQRNGWQLAGHTAGIIGYGAIGSHLANLLIAVGMDVVVSDPFVTETPPPVEHVSQDQLLARSDVVFPLAPAVPETRHLISETTLAQMKPGATLINVSRGDLVDEQAVLAALDNGRLRAFGADVGTAPDQRPPIGVAAHPGVVATPHLGGLTPQNADAQAASSVEQVASMLAGEDPPRAVNAEHATRLQSWRKNQSSSS